MPRRETAWPMRWPVSSRWTTRDRLWRSRWGGAKEPQPHTMGRMSRPARLSRTTLFVPASRPDMIPKAAASAADAVCIDLEDAVALTEKASSRAHVVQALRTLDFGSRTRIVRINGIDT